MRYWVPRLLRGAAAVAVVLDVAACSAPETRTSEELIADRALARRVEAALQADPYVDVDHVVVDADRGLVTLSGQVGDEWDRRSILKICEAVPGVRRAVDQLETIYYGSHRGE